MPGPINPGCLIMLYQEAGTTAGASIGDGDAIRYAGARTRKLPVEIDIALVGGTSATVVVETSPDNSTWTTWTTRVFSTTIRTSRVVGRVSDVFVRCRPSAQAGGGYINAYMIRGS